MYCKYVYILKMRASHKKKIHSSCSTNKGEAEKCSCRAAFPHGFSRGIKSITPFLGRTKHSRGDRRHRPLAAISIVLFLNFPTLRSLSLRTANIRSLVPVSVHYIFNAVKSHYRKKYIFI